MHPNSAFRRDDRAFLRQFAEDIGFGMLFASTPDGLRVVHIPFIFAADDRMVFHLSRGNAIAGRLDGATALFVVNGPNGYISPDWYGLGPDQVPTWNYLSAEFEGNVSRLDSAALTAQLDALSARQEMLLAPKPAWTRDKMSPGLFEKMHNAIIGFELRVAAWRGTTKLSQNKPQEARLRAADAAEAAGNRAIAQAMRNLPDA